MKEKKGAMKGLLHDHAKRVRQYCTTGEKAVLVRWWTDLDAAAAGGQTAAKGEAGGSGDHDALCNNSDHFSASAR